MINNNNYISKLSIHEQPTFNIGMVGHVSHGKSSVVRALTGVETFKYAKEKERGITIKIGYANCKIFRCPDCPKPICYTSICSKTKELECPHCGQQSYLVCHFSFIDCPGHESLMNTMLSGATLMDCAILLVDGSQKCPQPQTVEHLAALEILQIQKIVILQNKLDLIDGNKAIQQYDEIKEFVKHTCAENAPVIPISAQKKYNIDLLCEYIVDNFASVNRDLISTPKMNIIRSFDVNKPGSEIINLTGGVLGGSLIRGHFKIGDQIEIRPGLIIRNTEGKISWKPILTEITSMKTDSDKIDITGPGGLIGICTNLDSVLTRNDRMVGQVIGIPEFMPDVHINITAKCLFMKRVGISDIKVIKPKKGDSILLNITSKSVTALVTNAKHGVYSLDLAQPCCLEPQEKFSISVRLANSWRLIGMGIIL